LSKTNLELFQDQSRLDLSLRQVRYFVSVAEELHFGRAAERLHMAQPPLSQAIKRLEAQIGVQLFERAGRQVKLTEAGGLFLTECYPLLAQARRAADTARGARAGTSGVLHLGCVSSALYDLMPAVLPDYRAAHPSIELTISETDTATALDQISRGTLDIALIRRAHDTGDLRATPLRQDVLILALPRNHRLARQPEIALPHLAPERWVFVSRDVSPDYHDVFIAACHQAGFSPLLRHAARSIEAQAGLVACGLGVALVPQSARRLKLPGTIYRTITPRVPLVELAAVTQTNRASEPSLQTLIELLLAHSAAQPPIRAKQPPRRGARGQSRRHPA